MTGFDVPALVQAFDLDLCPELPAIVETLRHVLPGDRSQKVSRPLAEVLATV